MIAFSSMLLFPSVTPGAFSRLLGCPPKGGRLSVRIRTTVRSDPEVHGLSQRVARSWDVTDPTGLAWIQIALPEFHGEGPVLCERPSHPETFSASSPPSGEHSSAGSRERRHGSRGDVHTVPSPVDPITIHR